MVAKENILSNEKKGSKKSQQINKGINKILYQKRLEMNLSLKDAAKSLSISPLRLRLTEQGYLYITKKLAAKFSKLYNLEPDFFTDDLGYPVMIEEEETKIVGEFWFNIFHSTWFKIICFVLSLGFLAMTICGGVMNNYSITNTSSFFDNNTIVALRDYTIANPDEVIDLKDATPIEGINDKIYDLNNVYLHPTGFEEDEALLKVMYAGKEKNIIYTTLYGEMNYTGHFPSDLEVDQILRQIILNYKSGDPVKLNVKFNLRYSFGRTRIKMRMYLQESNFEIAGVTANLNGDWSDFNYTYKDVSFLLSTLKMGNVSEEATIYPFLINAFNSKCSSYLTQLNTFVSSDHVPFVNDLTHYSNNFVKGSYDFGMYVVDSMVLLLIGIIFTCLFLAFGLLFVFKRRPEPDLEEHVDLNDFVNQESVTREPAPLKKNWKIFPIFPGNLLKFISISLIFVYSLGFYFLFNNIVNMNISSAQNIINFENWLSPILIISYLLLFFVKLDYVQKTKNYFLTNYFWFFSGLALYMLYIFIGRTVLLDNTATANIGKFLLDVLPGNFLWGFLAFNMMVLLLFYKPVTYGNDQKKLLKYRLLSIIPVGYLVASLIIELGASYGGWVIPYSVSSLFFTKAVDLLVFALLFTFAMFIYKGWTKKKYGEENAELYQHGNRYYFIRNIVAAFIVLCIGVFEIGFHFGWPDNPIGMGEDYLILCAIPFVLLYHPHHGKRSAKWDNIFLAYYDTAYAIGIVLIALSVIVSIVTA